MASELYLTFNGLGMKQENKENFHIFLSSLKCNIYDLECQLLSKKKNYT